MAFESASSPGARQKHPHQQVATFAIAQTNAAAVRFGDFGRKCQAQAAAGTIIACAFGGIEWHQRALGELRKHYHKEVASRIVEELHKDLTGFPIDDLQAALVRV
jgi:protein required for attachment to host cells